MHDLVDRGLRHFHDRLRDAEDGSAELPDKKGKKGKAAIGKGPKKPPRKPPKRPPKRRRPRKDA